MKTTFDEFNMRKENDLLRKNLMVTRDNLRDNIILKHKLNEEPEGTEQIENLFRTNLKYKNSKKCYENANIR